MFHTCKSALLLTLIVCLALICVTPVPAGAQTLYGTMVGNVKDSSNAVIPGANVTATNQNTN